jgi:hypothetical protein
MLFSSLGAFQASASQRRIYSLHGIEVEIRRSAKPSLEQNI